MVAKALDVLDGRSAVASDIGCAFRVTVHNSSLAPAVLEKKFDFLVNAFHGYSHNYQCQRKNHPSVFEGIGLRDFETCERIFSSSNGLASGTQHASAFRRDLCNLGTFLLGNYKQALDVLENDSRALEESKQQFNVSDEDMDRWEKEQADFFARLGEEPETNTLRIEYVELLQALQAARTDKSKCDSSYFDCLEDSESTFVSETPGVTSRAYAAATSATMRLETQRRVAIERCDSLLRDVVDMECRLGITQRWIPGDATYSETLKYIVERAYHRAIDKLHKLVIQRLFELHKLNIAGYKMRTHIAKLLQTRSKAIRRAVDSYNTAASRLTPPREKLDWAKMSQCGYIEELTMLRSTRNDIRDKPWVKPVYREMLKLRHRIARAKEEITRCNVETCRVYTAIYDETELFSKVTTQLGVSNDPLVGPVRDFITRRIGINSSLLNYIQKIYSLVGFTGERTRGIRAVGHGTMDVGPTSSAEDAIPTNPDDDEDDEDVFDEDEEFQQEMRGLETFLSNLDIL
ncbi:hypothetical protein QCA50_013175 [Cerrena zonata]|uniref:Uncharacterized protein n=1 Tax=Cerrena zonata TaxID=2478898 RepID=A0AAW0G064_9APHY